MKKRGFSLVEVLITIFLIALISVLFFPSITKGLSYMRDTKKYTETTFTMQQDAENQILLLNNLKAGESWGDLTNPADKTSVIKKDIQIFGNTLTMIPKTVEAIQVDASKGTVERQTNGKILLVLPEKRSIKAEIPVVKKVILEEKKGLNGFRGRVEFDLNSLKKSWEEDIEFCVFRWHIGSFYSFTPDMNNLTLIQENNFAKKRHDLKTTQLSKESQPNRIDYKDVPYEIISNNIKDRLNIVGTLPNPTVSLQEAVRMNPSYKKEIYFFPNTLGETSKPAVLTNEQMKAMFRNKGLVLSVIPVSKGGLVGNEVYSNMVDLDFLEEDLIIAAKSFPDTLSDTHVIEGLLIYEPKVFGKGDFEIRMTGETDDQVYEMLVTVDKFGYASFQQELPTFQNYVVEAQDKSDKPSVFAKGRIEFVKESTSPIELRFVEKQDEYKITENDELRIQVLQDGNAVVNRSVEISVTDDEGRIGKFKKRTDSDGMVVFVPNPQKPTLPTSTNLLETNLGSYLSIGNHTVQATTKIGGQTKTITGEYVLKGLKELVITKAKIYQKRGKAEMDLVVEGKVTDGGQPAPDLKVEVILYQGEVVVEREKTETRRNGEFKEEEDFRSVNHLGYSVEVLVYVDDVVVNREKRDITFIEHIIQ